MTCTICMELSRSSASVTDSFFSSRPPAIILSIDGSSTAEPAPPILCHTFARRVLIVSEERSATSIRACPIITEEITCTTMRSRGPRTHAPCLRGPVGNPKESRFSSTLAGSSTNSSSSERQRRIRRDAAPASLASPPPSTCAFASRALTQCRVNKPRLFSASVPSRSDENARIKRTRKLTARLPTFASSASRAIAHRISNPRRSACRISIGLTPAFPPRLPKLLSPSASVSILRSATLTVRKRVSKRLRQLHVMALNGASVRMHTSNACLASMGERAVPRCTQLSSQAKKVSASKFVTGLSAKQLHKPSNCTGLMSIISASARIRSRNSSLCLTCCKCSPSASSPHPESNRTPPPPPTTVVTPSPPFDFAMEAARRACASA
mmetsp:Transcript_20992/g.53194  ORF Transcript_20992/g.53194 Transcript_20992/m.53194 type:complete len:382 (+) Transcript_20992:1047-2192(+)